MKLLFDENLSPASVKYLAKEYPGSKHVRDVGLKGASDRRIWDYAGEHGFVIVSKDSDFRDLGIVEGLPPKVVWLDVGNAGANAIANLLGEQRKRLERFDQMERAALLILPLPSPQP